ncbi:serine hydrolase domain-containing protein [Thermobifida cellulosilytica]|uniref:Beta-lactamase n=1 Tax=Thermobifida cellulosilytica TB100 TaxID=665004 RepID=A0A147KF87_THECS|nr:serine hydrolase domain-containing protein [Thermobifida cellulosilytica]KUP95928.1 beta-lactamase [Thermobifida cellulosilytica TB100]
MAGGLSRSGLDRLHEVLAARVARGELPGLVALVHRGGATHVEAIGATAVGGSAAMRRDTVFRVASMTKPVVAVAAMVLVEEGRLRLDAPVDPFLPELADRTVLRRVDGPLDDTVPARRPITLRDLLTMRCGFGLVLDPPGTPIQRALDEAGLSPGPDPFPYSADEFLRRLGELPLASQPGEAWLYHTGFDVLGILVERAAGQPLESFLRERVFEPIGMRDTGFHLAPEQADRLPACYLTDTATGAPVPMADPHDWHRPPAFASGGAGLLSTADDYLAFLRMLLDGGRCAGGRVLSRRSVELMTADQLTPEQRAGAAALLGEGTGWGFGVAVALHRTPEGGGAGRFGWDGGRGTSGHADPDSGLVGVLLTQLGMDSPHSPGLFADFWGAAYGAVDG